MSHLRAAMSWITQLYAGLEGIMISHLRSKHAVNILYNLGLRTFYGEE